MGNRRMISCFRIILLLLGAFSPVIKANGVEDIPAQVLASWLFCDADITSDGAFVVHPVCTRGCKLELNSNSDLRSLFHVSGKSASNDVVVLKAKEGYMFADASGSPVIALFHGGYLPLDESVPREYRDAKLLLALHWQIRRECIFNENDPYYINSLLIIDLMRQRVWNCEKRREEFFPVPFKGVGLPYERNPFAKGSIDRQQFIRITDEAIEMRAVAENEYVRLMRNPHIIEMVNGTSRKARMSVAPRDTKIRKEIVSFVGEMAHRRIGCVVELVGEDGYAFIYGFDENGRLRQGSSLWLKSRKGHDYTSRFRFEKDGALSGASVSCAGEHIGYSFKDNRVRKCTDRMGLGRFADEIDSALRVLLGFDAVGGPITYDIIENCEEGAQ